MADYGSIGMPKIVVLGGIYHTVFYNANNTVNTTALQNAINLALVSTGIDESENLVKGIRVVPNPADTKMEIVFALEEPSDVTVEVYNLTGRLLQTFEAGNLSVGENRIHVAADLLPSGVYLAKLQTKQGARFFNIVIAH